MADKWTTRFTPAASHACHKARGAASCTPAVSVAQAVLQGTGAIHHRIDARQMRRPALRPVRLPKVEPDPAFGGDTAGLRACGTPDGDDPVAVAPQPRGNCRPDKAARADQQDAQSGLSFTRRRTGRRSSFVAQRVNGILSVPPAWHASQR
jgi:hypothetical protein